MPFSFTVTSLPFGDVSAADDGILADLCMVDRFLISLGILRGSEYL